MAENDIKWTAAQASKLTHHHYSLTTHSPLNHHSITTHSLVQTAAVFTHFDKDKSGAISFEEFLAGVRGELSERRKQLVLMAFEVSLSPHSLAHSIN